jgi:hypothetical protein
VPFKPGPFFAFSTRLIVSCVGFASWLVSIHSVFSANPAFETVVPRGLPTPEPNPAETVLTGSPKCYHEAITAVRFLSDAGWPDPRRGEYREVVLPSGENPQGHITTHAWVLPAAKDNSRWAISWDGLVYPVLSVGAPANIDADLAGKPQYEGRHPFAGAASMKPARVSLAGIALLVRLERYVDAITMMERWEQVFGNTGPNQKSPTLLSLMMTEWMFRHWSRAVDAHRRGDHVLSEKYLETIASLRPRVEEQAVKGGVQVSRANYPGPMENTLNLAFLDQVPALIADSQRRLVEKIPARPEILDPSSIPEKSRRIALLLRDLEEVDARPLTSKSYNEYSADPVVKALVAQGEEAIDPLLDALEKDPRLTKTVDGDGWFGSSPAKLRIVGVEEPIHAALTGILRSRHQIPNLDGPYTRMTPASPRLPRVELARAIRGYWEANRGKPLAERWFGILTDDSATPAAWAEAAENLVGRQSQTVPIYGEMTFPRPIEPGQQDSMRGEIFRNRTDPSLTELMERRLRDAWGHGTKSTEPFAFRRAYHLANALAQWDGKNALATLRWFSETLKQFTAPPKPVWEFEGVDELVRMFVARHELGDNTALRDYVDWIVSVDAKHYSYRTDAAIFAPLWLYPQAPALAAVAEKLFSDPKSPWRSEQEGLNPAWVSRAAASPLVSVPEFRRLLIEQLKNPLVVGGAELWQGGRTAYFDLYLTNADYGAAESLQDPKQDVRLGDKIAERISKVRGAPEFSTTWPMEQRDAAITRIAEFLTRYGDRFSPCPDSFRHFDRFPTPWDDATESDAEIRMPVLDHPATREEFEAGRAIFSSEGSPERRIWPLPENPQMIPPGPRRLVKARWFTMEDFPEANSLSDGSKRFDQEVDVWQAEEALVDGIWKRTYGVVAKHRIAAVPGEEISFDTGFQASDGWNIHATLDTKNPDPGKFLKLGSADPVLVKVRLTNKRGVPQRFAPLAQATGPIHPADFGIEVQASYFAGPEKVLRTFGANPDWKNLPLHPNARMTMIPLTNEVETLETVDLLEFDAAQMFDLKKPGFYRMELTFRRGGIFSEDKAAGGTVFEVRSEKE